MTYDESCIEVDKMFEYYEANYLDDDYIRESINEEGGVYLCEGVSRGTLKVAMRSIIQEKFIDTRLEAIPVRALPKYLRVVRA